METVKQEVKFSTATEVTNDQALAYAMQVMSPTGYVDPADADDEHDRLMAIGIGLVSDQSPWVRGDHVMAIRRRRDNGRLTGDEMIRFAMFYKVSVKRLYANVKTAENWAPDRRRSTANVGYSHHEALNGLDPDVQGRLINQTDSEGLTVEETTTLARAEKGEPDNGQEGEIVDTKVAFAAAVIDLDAEEDDIAPENNLGGIGSSAPAAPRAGADEYDALAESLAEDEDAYSWSNDDKQVKNDREGFPLAFDPVIAAEQILSLLQMGWINEGWVATFMARLNELVRNPIDKSRGL